MESNAINYEVINKVTGDVHAVTSTVFDTTDSANPMVKVTTEIGEISFTNKDLSGDLQNPDFAIREVGTHLEADGVGTVEDVVPSESNEVA